MNTPVVRFNIVNQSFSVASILRGISGAEGITLRGPYAKPDLLITSWPQFLKVYGGYISNSDFPLLCKRAFDRGSQLRINKIGHYTNISDASTLDAIKASMIKVNKITFSASLVSGNSYALTINGTPIVPVVFATDSDTTMAAIATTIKASPYVKDAFVSLVSGTNQDDRSIIVIPENSTLSLTSSLVTSGSSQATTTITQITGVTNTNGDPLFTISPKYPGLDYNNLVFTVSNASNGDSAYFNLAISHTNDSSLAESYSNINIPTNPNPTVVLSHYLDDVKKASQLLDFTYLDLSSLTDQQRPVNGIYYFNGGSNGTAPILADYTGDSAGGTGLYAFDAVDDILQISVPELSDTTLHAAGAAYADNRKDLMYFGHLSNANTTQAALVADRVATGINSYYAALFAGGLKISDPDSGLEREISEMGDILGIMTVNDEQGPWLSPAGVNRGTIPNALGVVNNFGTTAKFNDLNVLTNRQVNMVIQKDGLIYLNGNYTAVLSNSKLSFMSAVRFLIFLQKSLSPTLQRYLQEPADIPTFKAIFREVEPFMDSLVTQRAIYSYRWLGDQDAKKIEDCVINNLTDLDNGKYKVKLYLKIIPSMQEIDVDLIVTATSVNFDNLNQ